MLALRSKLATVLRAAMRAHRLVPSIIWGVGLGTLLNIVLWIVLVTLPSLLDWLHTTLALAP